MVVKEFVQMRRDRMTFATMIFVPILQLTAVRLRHQHRSQADADGRADPRRRAADPRRAGGDAEHRLFRLQVQVRDPEELDRLIRSGEVQFAHRDPGKLRARRQAGRPARRSWSLPTPPTRWRRAPRSRPCRG